jgi:hypothetical protein
VHSDETCPVGPWSEQLRFEENDLVQDLLVLAATEAGHDVVVSVYGSREGVCGTVRFTFDEPEERSRSLRLLRRWAQGDVAVALLSHGDELSLFCERTVLDRALADAA